MFWKIVINVCEFFNWKVILFIYCNFIDIFKKVFYLFYWFLDFRLFYKKLYVVYEYCIFCNIWVENKLFLICLGKFLIFIYEFV